MSGKSNGLRDPQPIGLVGEVIEELAGGEDGDVAESTEGQEVVIAADDGVCLTVEGAGQKLVVAGNSGDNADFQMSGRLAVIIYGCPNGSQRIPRQRSR